MTIDELDAIFRDASWLITKRTGRTALKALTIGSESLDKTIVEIADMYDLTASERRLLRPSIADDVQSGASTAANLAKTTAGVATTVADASKIAKAAQNAWKTGRVGKSLLTVATHGSKAAQTFANTGRLVGKYNPIILGLTVAWTVGSSSWFGYHAGAFNLAAYELRKGKLAEAGEAS